MTKEKDRIDAVSEKAYEKIQQFFLYNRSFSYILAVVTNIVYTPLVPSIYVVRELLPKVNFIFNLN